MAQRRAGLPVRTGTRIQQTKSSMKGGETDMEEKTFLTVDEVAEILTVSVVDAMDKKSVEEQNVNYYNNEERCNRSR